MCVLDFLNVFKNAKEIPIVKIKMQAVVLLGTAAPNNYVMVKKRKVITVILIKNV